MERDPETYARANRFLQIGLVLGIAALALGQAGVLNVDYSLFACVILVAAGAGIRQIIVSRG
ncbi:MAG TPA: hypothetical protein VFZ34_24185 [Blastocatellia bacterium]|nr:hypothetical protein [Blastocatellia bacterium]